MDHRGHEELRERDPSRAPSGAEKHTRTASGTALLIAAVVIGLLGVVLVAFGQIPAILLIPIAVVLGWRAKAKVGPVSGPEARAQ